MAAGMDVHHFVMKHPRSLFIHQVFQGLYRSFIAGNNGRGKNHRISLLKLNVEMFSLGDSHQNRPLFSLGAGSQKHGFSLRIIIDFLHVNNRVLAGF